MNSHMDSLREASLAMERRPVWDKLGENDPSNKEQNRMYSGYRRALVKPQKSFWMTTNSEYGRFQTIGKTSSESIGTNQSDLERTMELLGSRLPTGRDPGASARSRAESVARDEALRTGQKADSISRRSTAMKLPDLRSRYLTLKGNQSGTVIGDYDRRKLTTGFAKSYMRSSCPRLWDNMRTIAEDAGFLRPESRQDTRTQILKVEHSPENDTNAFIDDILAGKDVETTTFNASNVDPPTEDADNADQPTFDVSNIDVSNVPETEQAPGSRQASAGFVNDRPEEGYNMSI